MIAGARQRLFVAVMPGPAGQEALAAAAAPLTGAGRAVPAANLHLTLAFLGAVEEAAAAAVEVALGSVAGDALDLEMSEVGHFARARVLWCAPAGPCTALRALEGGVRRALAGTCGPRDGGPFHPHVTVRRKVARYRGPARLAAPVRWPIRELALVRSETRREGARYEVRRAWPLQP